MVLKQRLPFIKFQKQHPELKADGIFGAKTRILLDKVLHD